jgi:hypothetical protein
MILFILQAITKSLYLLPGYSINPKEGISHENDRNDITV